MLIPKSADWCLRAGPYLCDYSYYNTFTINGGNFGIMQTRDLIGLEIGKREQFWKIVSKHASNDLIYHIWKGQ